MSNALRAKMIIVVVTTASVGASKGTITRRKICSSLAPSTRAASSSSTGIPLSAAEMMTVQKPVQIQTAATMRAKVLSGGLLASQAWGSKVGRTEVSTAL